MRQLTLIAIFVSALRAADGPIPINQDFAIAGSITPGDDPGFPVTISQPGSYRLTSNLVVPDANTTAISITTNSVTIDLNGFSIIGPVVCPADLSGCKGAGTGFGIQAGDPLVTRSVRVFNGTVRGMGNEGIQLNGDGSSVDRVTVESNAGVGMNVQGIITASSALRNNYGLLGLIIRDSSALQNAADGIVVQSGGSASGNVSSQNGGAGIYAPYATVTGNTLFLNRGAAIARPARA